MNAKGKKLIVPVVAIMMCAIALAGVAYALNNTTVSDNGSIENTGYQVIDLYTDKDSALTQAFSLTGIKIYTARVANTNTTTINADTTNAVLTPAAYIAVHKTATASHATDPDADLTNAVANPAVSTSVQGWTATNNVLTNNIQGCSVSITFTLGNAINEQQNDLNGYRPVQIAVSIGQGSYTGGAHAAAQAVQDALNGLTYTLTFTSTVA